MSVVKADGPPSWSLDASETWESTKCLWVGTLPSFARIKRPRWRPVGLNDRHLRSHGKIGDCEQSIFKSEQCENAGVAFSGVEWNTFGELDYSHQLVALLADDFALVAIDETACSHSGFELCH